MAEEQPLIATVIELVMKKDFDSIVDIANEPKYNNELTEFAEEVIDCHLTFAKENLDDPESSEKVARILNKVTESHGSARVNLLGLLKFLEDRDRSDHGEFCAQHLFTPLGVTLRRCAQDYQKRFASDCSDTFEQLLKLFPAGNATSRPSQFASREERMFFETDESFLKEMNLITELRCRVLKPILESGGEDGKAREVLVQFFCDLLAHIFENYPMFVEEIGYKSVAMYTASSLAEDFLSMLGPNFISVFKLVKELKMGLLCLAFLLTFDDNLSGKFMPQIYHTQYLLTTIVVPFSPKNDLEIRTVSSKWLELLNKYLLQTVALTPDSTLILSDCLTLVSRVACSDQDEVVRNRAFKILMLAGGKIEDRDLALDFVHRRFKDGRELRNSSLKGWAIGKFKDICLKVVKNGVEVNLGPYFRLFGHRKCVFFNIFFSLDEVRDENGEVNIVDHSYELVAALNCLWILLRCDEKDLLGLKSRKSDLIEEFVKPIRSNVKLCRAHYEAQAQNREQNIVTGTKLPDNPVAKNQMSKIIVESINQLDILDNALSRFDDVI